MYDYASLECQSKASIHTLTAPYYSLYKRNNLVAVKAAYLGQMSAEFILLCCVFGMCGSVKAQIPFLLYYCLIMEQVLHASVAHVI